jgi:hypothetical protein
VDKVAIDYKKPTQRELDQLTVAEAKKYMAEGQFPAGSMGPKIAAAIDFLENRQTRHHYPAAPVAGSHRRQKRNPSHPVNAAIGPLPQFPNSQKKAPPSLT